MAEWGGGTVGRLETSRPERSNVMGMKLGYTSWKKWKAGEKLTRRHAILAHCYTCNGEDEGGYDCEGEESCPLYQYFPKRYKGKRQVFKEES